MNATAVTGRSVAPVRAVIVAHPGSPRLAEVLEAVAAQQYPLDAWHLVIAGDPAGVADLPTAINLPVLRSGATDFGGAIAELLASEPAAPGERLWLLHADSAPLPDALGTLMATARKRKRAAVVGPGQVRWDDPSRLVNVGITVSRWGARRLNVVDEDDVNQGQHDGRDDVLAVGLAGALVDREVWERLGGTDPAYQGFGDSIDFCRRVWLTGHDVVVSPTAKVRHAQDSLYGRTDGGAARRGSTYAARRVGEWYHALAWAPLWAVPLLFVWAFVSSLGRAVSRIAANQPRAVTTELAVPWRLLGRLSHVPGSRARVAAATARDRTATRALLASPLAVFRHVRTREWGAYEQWRAESTPSTVQQRELKAIRHKRWQGLAAVTLLAGALTGAVFGTWAGPLAQGEMLAGQSLGVTDVTTADLWARSVSGWSDAGWGGPALDGAGGG